MKKVVPVLMLLILMAFTANAQHIVDLEYYQTENNYVLLNLPANSLALSRYHTTAPARIQEMSFWFVTQPTAGDSVDIYFFGDEGGMAFPYFLMPVIQPIRMYVPANVDSLYRIQFSTPLDLGRPRSFFIGVMARGSNVTLRMDRITQQPTCATSAGDTMYTSMFATYDGTAQAYGFGAHFTSGMAINNWYMGVKCEYYNETVTKSFKDVTSTANLKLKTGGSTKVAWADFDADGYQDCLWGNHLFRNKGNGSFEDVASTVGFSKGSKLGMLVDVDNDGDLDIVGMPDNLLYINTNGTFALDNDPGFDDEKNSTAMSFVDYDNDNYPDFFVANGEYMHMKNPANPSDSALVEGAAWEGHFYLNTGTGKFSDQKTAYLGGYMKGPWGKNPYNTSQSVEGWRPSRCVQWFDYDDDGDMDLFVGNDRLQPDYLFRNEGTGELSNVARQQGLEGLKKTAYPGYYGNTTGCDVADIDNNGMMDIVKSSNALPYRIDYSDVTSPYKNGGNPNYMFTNTYTNSGFGYQAYNGDVAFGDFNNDGLIDLYVTTGETCFPAILYMQNPDNTFTDVTYLAGVAVENATAAAWVDFDNDGQLDLCVVTGDGLLHLYKNQMTGIGNWTGLTLKSKTANDFALGSQIKVYTGSTIYTKQIVAGKGAGVQEPYTQYFGLGAAAQIDSVTIRWPKGNMETLKNINLNAYNSVIEYVYDPTSTQSPSQPERLDLQQNFPNPFSRSRNSLTNIGYNLPASASVKLDVYDMQGALVRTLVNMTQSAGMHFVQWDGKDMAGKSVAAGTYQYVLTTNGVVLNKRLIVLK